MTAPRRATLVTLLALASALALAALAFSRWTLTSSLSFPRFLIALFALVYLPGKALLDRVRPKAEPLEDLALSLGLGLIASSAFYWIAAALGQPRLAPLLAPLSAGALLARRGRAWNVARPDWHHAALVGLVVAACAPLALLPVYYNNLDHLPGGLLTYCPWPDAILHLSVANALTRQVPPDVPFLPGVPLRYHYGMDLLAAMLSQGAGLDVGDLTVRFVPTLLLALLVLATFCFARAFLGSAPAALLLALLVLFGDDLAWLPGLLLGSPEPWSVHFFGMPAVMSLYGLNPMLPALALLFLALLSLLRFNRERSRGWLIVGGVLLAATAAYKVFTAAQALAALGLTAAVHALRFRERQAAAAFALAAGLALPLVAAISVGVGPRTLVRIEPWPYVPAALIRSGLFDTWLGRQTDALLGRGLLTPVTLAAFFGVAVPLYLAATFGARLMGLGRLVRALRPQPGEPLRLLLAVFVLLGPALALVLAITPATYPPRLRYNEAAWFLVQSKFLAWVFAVEALLRVARSGARRGALLTAAVLLSSLPSTVQYFAYQVSIPQTRWLGPQETELLSFVRGLPPGQVAWARSEVGEALIALTPCRASVFTVHPFYFLGAAELELQRSRLAEFWSAWREGRLRRDLVEAYGASLIVVDKEQDGAGPSAEPALRRAYENGRYLVLSWATGP